MEDYNLVGLLGNYLLRIKKEMNMGTIRRSGRVQHFALNSYIFDKDFFSNATIVIPDAQNLSCSDHELWSWF